MKRVLSVWMAAARDVLWKLLLILIAMTGAELLLLRVMERVKEGNDNLSLITVMVSEDE